MAKEPIGDVMIAMGRSFLGSPYVAHTLEVPGNEHLVVNLREFDCVTFVESTLSLARAIRAGHPDFGLFERQLQTVRYRSGIVDGYPGRLHYFVDWIADNSRKKIVRDITGDIGGVRGTKVFDFMSSHRELYRQLSDEAFLSAIRERERALSSVEYAVLPKEKIAAAQGLLKNGDIIAITLSTPGIDVAHTGVVYADGKKRKLMHASQSAGKVEISTRSIADLVTAGGAYTGIMIARPLEPES